MTDLVERLTALCERHKGVTPGEWEARKSPEPDESIEWEVVVRDEVVIALTYGGAGPRGNEENAAENARAIADLPAMLAALREAATELARLTAENERLKKKTYPTKSGISCHHQSAREDFTYRSAPTKAGRDSGY